MLVWVRTSYLYAKRDPAPFERLGRNQGHFAWVEMKPSNVALELRLANCDRYGKLEAN